MRRKIAALLLGLGLIAPPLIVYGQITGASTGVRTVVDDLIEWTGLQKFRNDVTIGGTLTTTGGQTSEDVTATDDLAVGDDAAITGDLTVTGTTTLTGGLVNGSNLFTTASLVRHYAGNTTLTEAGGVETILTVTNATLTGFGGVLEFRVVGADAADVQVRTGILTFSGVNKAGTTTCVESTADETGSIAALSSGTLTYALVGTPGANTCIVTINIDSSLTLTSASVAWKLTLYGPGTVS